MNAADFQPLIDWLTSNPNWVLFAIVAVAFVESLALAGIIVPGVLLLFLVAAVAGSIELPLWQALTAGFLGAVGGDVSSFYIGHYFKHDLHTRWPFSRYPKALETGKSFFDRHGGKSVILGRFIGPIRPVLPLIAGMVGMSQVRFISFNLASALAWSPFYILPGYIAGSSTQVTLPENFYLVLSGFIIAILMFVFIFRYLSINLQKDEPLYRTLKLKQQNSVKLQKFWQKLSSTENNSGEIPLASIALFFIATCLFILWSIIVLHFGHLQNFDQFMLEFAVSLRSGQLDTILIILTLLGDELFLYFSFTVFVIVMICRRSNFAAIHLVVSGLSAAAITHGLKDWFSIARPNLLLNQAEFFSYPSGHSSGSTLFYGLIASFIAQEVRHSNRWKIYVCFGIPIILIGLSRVFLTVHWISDVIGGILLGLVLSGITRIIYSRYALIDKQNQNRSNSLIYLSALIWLCGCVLYQLYFHTDSVAAYTLMGSN